MNLMELGWNSFFEKQVTDLNLKDPLFGRVSNLQKGFFLLISDKGEHWGKLSGNFSFSTTGKKDVPAVGDWVVFTWHQGDDIAIIHKLLNRQNRITRAESGFGREKGNTAVDEQIIAANVDLVFIVSGLDRDYNPRRIERYLTMVYDSGALPIIILNKADLCPEAEERQQEIEAIAIGVSVYCISAEKSFDESVFRDHIKPGVTSALLGSSGVGKSTIINRLTGSSRQLVAPVSQHVNKGTHTTTSRELIVLPQGGMIIDNPGMRELQLLTDEEGLEKTFSEIETLALECRFSDCKHQSEPGCKVQEALEDGTIQQDRFNSYLKLRKELQYFSLKDQKGNKFVEREKSRKIRLMVKQYNKLQRNK